MSDSVPLWTAAHQVSLSLTISQSSFKFKTTELVILLTISSYATPFSFCLQSFPASGSFPMSRLFASGGQITGVSASASVLPMNIQGWFPLGLTNLISLLSLKSLFQHHSLRASVLQHSAFFTKMDSQTTPKGTDEFSVSIDANTICHKDSTLAH